MPATPMPTTPTTPAAATPTPAPDAPVIIRHDAIWGFHANVTAEQLPKLDRFLCLDDDEICLNEKAAARLHEPGLNFVVFPLYHTAGELIRDFNVPYSPFTIAREILKIPPTYQPPVLQILTLPEPQHAALKTPPNYYHDTHHLTPADIPELTRLYRDPEIAAAECHEESPVRHARIHAQRALYELRAPGLAHLMLAEIRAANGDSYEYTITSDATELLAQLGPDAYTTTLAHLESHPDDTAFFWDMFPRLADIVQQSAPGHRDHCIAQLTRRLADHPVNDRFHNTLLVAALRDLRATESAPLIEQAYAAGHVDERYHGDWENAQIALGLKTKRDTPPLTPDANAPGANNSDYNETAAAGFGENFPGHNNIPHRNPAPKIGRNDPCPCGSGKKYKKCCMGKMT